MTLKLAEFQFVRVYLDIERDCDPDMEIEAIDALYDKLEDSMIDKLEKATDRAFEERLVRQ